MTTYVARHHLALFVVITAELTTRHSTTPTTTPIGHRTSTSTPTVGLGVQAVAETHATATSTLESPPPRHCGHGEDLRENCSSCVATFHYRERVAARIAERDLATQTSWPPTHTPTLPFHTPENNAADVPPGPPAGILAPTVQVPPGPPEGNPEPTDGTTLPSTAPAVFPQVAPIQISPSPSASQRLADQRDLVGPRSRARLLPNVGFDPYNISTASLIKAPPAVPPQSLRETAVHVPRECERQGFSAERGHDIYRSLNEASNIFAQQQATASNDPRPQAKPSPPARRLPLHEWRATADDIFPPWFGHMTPARLAELQQSTPAPQPKAPLALHTGHNFEAAYDPLKPTSSFRKAVMLPPQVTHCLDKTQATFEAWRCHATHKQFGRAYKPHERHNRD